MIQRGRKSAAALAVVDTDVPGFSRLGAPATVSEGERRVWVTTVNSRPAEWFGSEHVPVLVSYVRHVVAADVIDEQIRAFDPEWLKDAEGLKRYQVLRKLFREETAMINVLARAMRLTQQSLYRGETANTMVQNQKGSHKPWERSENHEE